MKWSYDPEYNKPFANAKVVTPSKCPTNSSFNSQFFISYTLISLLSVPTYKYGSCTKIHNAQPCKPTIILIGLGFG